MISTILFDLDGVIINSNPQIIDAWTKVASNYNITLTESDIKNDILGVTGNHTLNKIFSHLDKKTQKEVHEQVDLIEETANYDLVPGFKDFYNSLLKTNLRLGVVTSSWRRKLLNVFEQHSLTGFFCVVTREDVSASKPAPEPYTKAINFWNESPTNVLIFEDSNNGIQSALSAGANCIAINNKTQGIHYTDDFRYIKVNRDIITTPDKSYTIISK
ncbi:HAD family hydrolase [Pasteurella testudinis]|uniref:HAD family hydrolase n=1 Tax=Pasteurella testudinis TaxID=761 RepID=UPI004058E07B